MRSGDIADRVDLNEPKAADQRHHIQRSGRRFGQPIAPKPQPARVAIGDFQDAHVEQLRCNFVSAKRLSILPMQRGDSLKG